MNFYDISGPCVEITTIIIYTINVYTCSCTCLQWNGNQPRPAAEPLIVQSSSESGAAVDRHHHACDAVFDVVATANASAEKIR